MKLLTKEIERKLEKRPLYSTDGQKTKEVIVKFFNPCGAGRWYVCEGERQDEWALKGTCIIRTRQSA